MYDDVIYDEVTPQAIQDPTFNIAGWTSSYTGLPIAPEGMREQVDQTVSRILSGAPDRVLEIGCGTGLLLFRVAPHCGTYWGTDFSRVSIDYVESQLAGPLRNRVQLSERLADDFSGIEDASVDAVVINSVVQYFPGADYLERVLDGAVHALAAGGRLFVGDVRSLELLDAFHAAVQLHQAPDEASTTALAARVRQHVEQEQELLVAPAFFRRFAAKHPRITAVTIGPKRGKHRHELNEFRYDVILEVEGPPARRGSDHVAGVEQRIEHRADARFAAQRNSHARLEPGAERPGAAGGHHRVTVVRCRATADRRRAPRAHSHRGRHRPGIAVGSRRGDRLHGRYQLGGRVCRRIVRRAVPAEGRGQNQPPSRVPAAAACVRADTRHE